MNVSEYARYLSATVVCSRLEADVDPVAYVVLCLVETVALGVELTSPLHSVLLRSLLSNATFGDASSRYFFPRVGHWLSRHSEIKIRKGAGHAVSLTSLANRKPC